MKLADVVRRELHLGAQTLGLARAVDRCSNVRLHCGKLRLVDFASIKLGAGFNPGGKFKKMHARTADFDDCLWANANNAYPNPVGTPLLGQGGKLIAVNPHRESGHLDIRVPIGGHRQRVSEWKRRRLIEEPLAVRAVLGMEVPEDGISPDSLSGSCPVPFSAFLAFSSLHLLPRSCLSRSSAGNFERM